MGRNGRVVCVWDFSLDKLTLWQEEYQVTSQCALGCGKKWMDGWCVCACACVCRIEVNHDGFSFLCYQLNTLKTNTQTSLQPSRDLSTSYSVVKGQMNKLQSEAAKLVHSLFPSREATYKWIISYAVHGGDWKQALHVVLATFQPPPYYTDVTQRAATIQFNW